MEEKNINANETQQSIDSQLNANLNEVHGGLKATDEVQDSIGGDENYVDIIDIDYEPQLYPGAGISMGGRGSDEETNEFARNAFGGSDYNDDLDMDQQSQAYWDNL